MEPSASALSVPLSVTVAPEVTDWAVPAFALGDAFAGGGGGGGGTWGSPPPPLLEQAARSNAATPARIDP